MSTSWSDEDALLRALGAALSEADETPSSIGQAGRDLYVWRTVDTDLAELMDDSARAGDLVATRDDGASTRRSLSFRSAQLDIELDLETAPDAIRGQLVSRDAATEHPTEVVVELIGKVSITTPVDQVGYFAVDPFPLAYVRFRLRCGNVATPWID